MDVSNYGIRVVRMRPRSFKMEIPTGKRNPIDIPGTVLTLQHNSAAAMRAMQKEDWYSLIFGELSAYVRVRWDNDTKSTLGIHFLHIVDLGKLPMYKPLYSDSELDFEGKFDRRRAEERRPITINYIETLIDKTTLRTYAKVSKAYRTITEPVPVPVPKLKQKRPKNPGLWKDYYSTKMTYNEAYGGYGNTTDRLSNVTSYADTSDWITVTASSSTGSTN